MKPIFQTKCLTPYLRNKTMLLDQVRAYCLKHGLLGPGLVIVAVSGGADSLTLLHFLLKLQNDFGHSVHVATLDHRIRGITSAEDVQYVCEITASWRVSVTTGIADVPALALEWGTGLEEAARRARYAFLAKVAAQLNATTIAIGHNQDDQAETVLLHIIRGSGLGGLRGMLPKSPLSDNKTLTLIRPLLDTPRSAIEAYLRDLGIQPRIDTTNADTHYTRNRLRHEIMPVLAEINPQIRSALARTAETSREDFALLISNLPSLSFSRSGLSIDRVAFSQLTIAQQRLLIREAVYRLAPDMTFSFERTESALHLAMSSTTKSTMIALGGGLNFLISSSTITITSMAPKPLAFPDYCPSLESGVSIAITGPGTYLLPDSTWQLNVEHLPAPDLIYSDPLSATLAIESGQNIELRTRHPGDHFKPLGLGGHSQKLKDTLINLKVPADWRDCVPILTVDNEIAWLVAPTAFSAISRISETFAVSPGDSRPIWRFTFTARGGEYSSQ
jgi:tRNA(Ile)-lysidine synthase